MFPCWDVVSTVTIYWIQTSLRDACFLITGSRVTLGFNVKQRGKNIHLLYIWVNIPICKIHKYLYTLGNEDWISSLSFHFHLSSLFNCYIWLLEVGCLFFFFFPCVSTSKDLRRRICSFWFLDVPDMLWSTILELNTFWASAYAYLHTCMYGNSE